MKKPILAIVLAVVAAAAVLVLDPMGLFAGPDWQFEEADMRAAVEGDWSLTITEGAVTKTWKLQIRQSDRAESSSRETGLVRSASACGNRTFVRSASACGYSTRMPIDITVLDEPKAPPAKGFFIVGDTKFEQGQLEIRIGTDLDHMVAYASAHISPRGEVLKISTMDPKTAKLVRTRVTTIKQTTATQAP